MDQLSFFFNNLLINPMLNILVMLYSILFSNFGLAIISFTVIVRLLTMPLTVKQTRQMKAMQGLQPKMRELQTRYSKDPQKRSKETMRLYREAGVNPLGCLGPMIVQLPIWIGLYQALLKSLGTNPDDLVGLSQRLYSWNPLANTSIPLDSHFLGMDLANPDPTSIIMPVLVGASTWAQQKMTTMPSMDERSASTNRMMLWMMPLMLAFFALQFPSGLALYWVASNLIGIAIQGHMTKDWSPLVPSFVKRAPAPEPAPQPAQESEPEEIEADGRTTEDGTTRVEENVRKDRRRSHRGRPDGTRRKPGRGRNRNTKPR